MSDATVRFGLLVSMFQAMLRDRSAAKKRKRFRTFLDRVYTDRDYFSAVRLILPSLDRERGSYGLKESALANCLVDALAIAKDSDDALRLVNWRKGGARAGANAGNFALIAAEVMQRRQGLASGGMTIKEVNDALDQLASKESRGEKTTVLSDLLKRTNALEMKWILMIILKDLKLGISEKSIFHEFHPDAEDLFNVTCDLKLVCEKLKDRNQRHRRQDIEVGKAVRPQLAMRIADATTAWKKFHGKSVVVECKFDGDRIQIHKNGSEIRYFSRNFFDHSEYAHGMSNIIMQNIQVDRCILDGEMLVWDTSTNCFAEFGSNQEIAKAAREGLESDRQLCYVAFDVLYVGDTSVIHQSLTERHDLLRKVVKPLKGRLEILIPNSGLNEHRSPGEPCWSALAYSLEDVERFFKETIDNREEGIVLKDLGSKWEPGDRSVKWMKLKPDYIHASADLDVLIIGGYFGSGRRGGEVAQFLVGLAEPSASGSHPKRFISFCRVGTGLSDEELDALVNKLKPFFRKNEYPKRAPRFYEVTNHSKERPDVWIESPDKSAILSITSDIRTIKSEVFAAPYSLRFPRIQRVRDDKPWHECLDLQSFLDLVHSSNGNTQGGAEYGASHNQNLKHRKATKPTKRGEKKKISAIPSHFVQTDVSDVKEQTLIFANMMFYFVNVPLSYTIDQFHKMVAENGGNFSMNLNDSVTHCIAADKKGIKYQAATRHGDVIHVSWILDCCAQKRLMHLQPKYFLFLAESSKSKFHEEIDAFSDYYFWDLDVTDLKQIFENMKGAENSKSVDHYKRKYFVLESMNLLQDCRIYFYEMPIANKDLKTLSELTLRRMRLEVSMRSELCNSLPRATHLVAYSTLGSHNFDDLYKSFPSTQRRHLHDKRLHVVRHQWLDDSLEQGRKLLEDAYNMKPDTLEDLKFEERKEDTKVPRVINIARRQKDSEPLEPVSKQKRGRPPRSNTRTGRAAPKPQRRTRARVGTRAAKIASDELESSESADESEGSKEVEKPIEIHEDLKMHESSKRPIQSNTRKRRATPKPQRGTRARTGKCVANIQDESENSDHVDEHEKPKVEEIIAEGLRRADAIKDHERAHDANTAAIAAVQESAADDRFSALSRAVPVAETGKKETGEYVADPLQAMLFDMIPSLSQKGVVTIQANKTRPEPEGDGLQADPDDVTVKPKKKVSYKDVAGELLKDW